MAFSSEQLGFVVRVVRKGDGDSFSTGILVSPNTVLTCAHNLLAPAEWMYHKDRSTLGDADIGENGATVIVEVQGCPIAVRLTEDAPKFHPEGEDLVSLTIEETVDVTPATFLTGFDEESVRQLEDREFEIHGYRKGATSLTSVRATGK